MKTTIKLISIALLCNMLLSCDNDEPNNPLQNTNNESIDLSNVNGVWYIPIGELYIIDGISYFIDHIKRRELHLHRSYSPSLMQSVFPDLYQIYPIHYKPYASIIINGIECRTTSIEKEALKGADYISTFNTPSTVTTIGASAFEDCTNLRSVRLPENLVTIEDYCFAGCTSLPDIVIPPSVKTINNYAFANCTSLSSITLPENLSSFYVLAFYGCKNLKSLVIPKSVTRIYGYSGDTMHELFPESGIKDVYTASHATMTSCSITINPGITLHVPAGTYDWYSTTRPWCYFGIIKEDYIP